MMTSRVPRLTIPSISRMDNCKERPWNELAREEHVKSKRKTYQLIYPLKLCDDLATLLKVCNAYTLKTEKKKTQQPCKKKQIF